MGRRHRRGSATLSKEKDPLTSNQSSEDLVKPLAKASSGAGRGRAGGAEGDR